MIPVDETARIAARSALSRSIALEAGAGAGKTSVLVDRVCALLEAGVPPGRIAVVTFTEAAAAELKARVTHRLQALPVERGAEPSGTLDRAFLALPQMVAMTIHAFCLRLLRLCALEAGWSPKTRIIEALGERSATRLAYEEAWARLGRAHPGQLEAICQSASPSALYEAALERMRFRDLKAVAQSAPLDLAQERAQLSRIEQALCEAAKRCQKPALCRLYRGNAKVLSELLALGGRSDEEALEACLLLPRIDKRGGKAADWSDQGHLRFKEGLDALRSFQEGLLERRRYPLHATVMQAFETWFLPAARAKKRALLQADYDDLLFEAKAALSLEPVRLELASRFSAILVDEVQDTDPIQAEIVLALCQGPDGAPLPGRLFVVGDPKQSIYRFRRADVGTWAALSGQVAKNGVQLSLTQNFRSAPQIVAFINHAFSKLPGYRRMEAYRSPQALSPVVVLPCAPEDEIAQAVAHVDGLLRAGVGASEVMVLLPSWTRARAVQEAFLDAGIGAVVEGAGSFFERDEVRLCIAALSAIDEPADAEAIVTTLRGLFGLTYEALAQHAQLHGRWSYLELDAVEPGPVKDALLALQALHLAQGSRSWPALLDMLLSHTLVEPVFFLMRRGASARLNLQKLRALLSRLSAQLMAPGEVIERLALLAREGEEQELPIADPEHQALKITTLFRAKGLEAKVVVLLCARRSPRAPLAIVDRKKGQVGISAGRLYPPGYKEMVDADRAEQQEEMRRWMYVAATRAKDQLVICHTARSNLLAPDLLSAIPKFALTKTGPVEVVPGVTVHIERPRPPMQLGRQEIFPGLDDQIDAAQGKQAEVDLQSAEAFLQARAQLVKKAQSRGLRWASVSSLVKPAEERGGYTTSGRGVGPLGGTVVHRVMEALELGRPAEQLRDQVEPMVRLYAQLEGFDEARAPDCARIVHDLLDHDVVRWAQQAPERWQELPFAFKEEGRIVSGVIDLCFPADESKKRWVVADWKSSLPPKGSPLRKAYEAQLAYYARALLQTMQPIEHIETVLVGPHPLYIEAAQEALLSVVHPALLAPLDRLLQRGLLLPEVGLYLGPGRAVLCELVFEPLKLVVLLDPAAADIELLEQEGYRVLSISLGTLGSVASAMKQVEAVAQDRGMVDRAGA